MKLPALVFALALSGLVALPAVAAQSDKDSSAPATRLDTVLVVGEQPGPGLWKVSNGDHVLWILGVLEPLPKQLKWRNDEIEAKIAQSQEVIGLSVGNLAFIPLLSLPSLGSAVSYKELPDGKQLRDVLSPELYAQWAALKERHAPRDDGLERLRPAYAAGGIYDKALDRAGLETELDVWKAVRKLARRHHVHVVTNDFDVFVRHPNDAFRQLAAAPADAGMACFEARLGLLEDDLRDIRLRANAWSTGDIGMLRTLGPVDERWACTQTLLETAPAMQEPLAKMKQRLVDDWLREAETALAKNRSTVAVQLMSRLLASDGVLAALREKGYEVEEPE